MGRRDVGDPLEGEYPRQDKTRGCAVAVAWRGDVHETISNTRKRRISQPANSTPLSRKISQTPNNWKQRHPSPGQLSATGETQPRAGRPRLAPEASMKLDPDAIQE